MSEDRRGFLRRIRARMRLAWLTATSQRYAPHVGVALLVILVADWLTPFDQGLLVAGLLLAVYVTALLVIAFSLRISDWDASRAAERGLGGRDALTTALEFTDEDDDVHRLIQDRADTLVAASTAADAIPLHADRSRLRQFGMAAALAIAIGILPPLGSTPALSSDAATAIEEEAANLERIAEAVAETDVENADEIVAELERLAEELRQAETAGGGAGLTGRRRDQAG